MSGLPRAALLVVAVSACGARTGLGVTELADGGPPRRDASPARDASPMRDVVTEPAPAPDAPVGPCGAPDPATAFAVSNAVQQGAMIASSGCSFAGTWIENRQEPHLYVDAVILRVRGGAWRASTNITVATGSIDITNSWIAWDGSAYVVAWADSGLFVARLAEDGTLLAPPVRAFDLTADGTIQGMAVGADGQIRLGLLNDPVRPLHYRTYFARLLGDGTVMLPPTRLVPPRGNDISVAFLFGPRGDHQLLWEGGDPLRQELYVDTFDDEGNVLDTSSALVSGDGIQIHQQALAAVGTSTIYGEWTYQSPHVALRSTTSSTVVHAPGGYAPALATLPIAPLGALGVLAPESESGPTPLVLSEIVVGTSATSSEIASSKHIRATGSGDGPLEYAVAGGTGSFGVLWTDNVGAYLTIWTP